MHICKDTKTCDECRSTSCYEKRCGTWSKWNRTAEFYWNDKKQKCLEKQHRTCKTEDFFQCQGPSEQMVNVTKEKCGKFDTTTVQPSNSTTTPQPPPSDVTDDRFWITLWASLITALVVGVCVMHAVVSYEEGKRIEGRVYRVPQST